MDFMLINICYVLKKNLIFLSQNKWVLKIFLNLTTRYVVEEIKIFFNLLIHY